MFGKYKVLNGRIDVDVNGDLKVIVGEKEKNDYLFAMAIAQEISKEALRHPWRSRYRGGKIVEILDKDFRLSVIEGYMQKDNIFVRWIEWFCSLFGFHEVNLIIVKEFNLKNHSDVERLMSLGANALRNRWVVLVTMCEQELHLLPGDFPTINVGLLDPAELKQIFEDMSVGEAAYFPNIVRIKKTN